MSDEQQLTRQEIEAIATVVSRLARGRGKWFDAEATAVMNKVRAIALRFLMGSICRASLLLLPLLAPPTFADTIPLQNDGGTYLLPVVINNAITLKFVIDTGASDVSIPADVVSTLMRAGAVEKSDFIGTGTYVLADGSKLPSVRLIVRELKVGDHIVRNVSASVAPAEGALLLGQSFLSKLPAWTIDYKQQTLVVGDGTKSGQTRETDVQDQMAVQLKEAGDSYLGGDYDTALRLLRPLANSGVTRAQTLLGVMYALGKGVPKSDDVAMWWYRKAAAQGDAHAQYQIGVMYLFGGEGVPRDDKEAAMWFSKSAEQGFADAQFDLGLAYETGHGVVRDYIQAYKWYSLAVPHLSDSSATTVLNKLAAKMTRAQIAEAQKLARDWQPVSQTSTSTGRSATIPRQ